MVEMVDGKRRSWLRVLLYAVVVAVAVLVWLRLGAVRLAPPERSPAASALSMRDLSGRAVALDDFAGRVVVVNVWASWCGPCRAEIPAFGRVYEAYREQGLEIVGLNVDDMAPDAVARVARELGVRYPVTRVDGGFGGTFDNPVVIPHSWFIDRAGRVRGSHSGVLSESALANAVTRLLRDP